MGIKLDYTYRLIMADMETSNSGEYKIVIDRVDTSESIQFDATKLVTDYLNIFERIALSSTKLLTDSISTNSEINYSLGKNLFEALTVQDNAILNIEKGAFVEYLSFSSSSRYSLIKSNADSVSCLDSGTVVQQNFTSSSYFANDYIGATTSF